SVSDKTGTKNTPQKDLITTVDANYEKDMERLHDQLKSGKATSKEIIKRKEKTIAAIQRKKKDLQATSSGTAKDKLKAYTQLEQKIEDEITQLKNDTKKNTNSKSGSPVFIKQSQKEEIDQSNDS